MYIEVESDDPNVDPFMALTREEVENEIYEEQHQEDGMSSDDVGNIEIGNEEIGNEEIGAYEEIGSDEGDDQALAVQAVIKKARDNRQPPPKMKAVDADAPMSDHDFSLTDTFIGAAGATGLVDPFPLTSKLLLRFGGGDYEPRYVRVDTEKSYEQFRAQHSPEVADLAARVNELQAKVEEHVSDPHAHQLIADEIMDVDVLGAEVAAAEQEKKVDLYLPKWADGKVKAWREGDFVCASMALPGSDGELRICTSMEPAKKGVDEMARHAAESGVPEETIIGVLPAMGCILGAGTLVKEMAAAAPSILARPEARGKEPFVVRIEPKANPAVCALVALALACKNGNEQACLEWRALGEASPAPVKQAMTEALELVKKVAA